MNRTISLIGNSLKKKRGKLSRSFEKLRFNALLNRDTTRQHTQILSAAEQALEHEKRYESNQAYASSDDPLVQQGFTLRNDLCTFFYKRFEYLSNERILIHTPSAEFSPAGYSLFSNIAESFAFIGIPTKILEWGEGTKTALNQFNPTILLSSDHHEYLNRLEWNAIEEYRTQHRLQIGLTASLAEYGNTPLLDRLKWAKIHRIDFYYSFRDKAYVDARSEYKSFSNEGYPILLLPFGANALHYYPVAGFSRDLNYVLMASRKREHISYLQDIATKYAGFIDGPGWGHTKNFKFLRDRDRYIYARAKIGLNVHLPEQLEWACELNERTYQLAACGVPQLIDHPLLLDKVFSKDAFFIADNPRQYFNLFKDLINNPQLGQSAALLAQQEVFSAHTTFHRAASFIEQLKTLPIIP